MKVCTPLAIDQVPEFVSSARGQVQRNAPNAVPILRQGSCGLVPVIEISGEEDPVSPDARRQFEGDADMTRSRRVHLADHRRTSSVQHVVLRRSHGCNYRYTHNVYIIAQGCEVE